MLKFGDSDSYEFFPCYLDTDKQISSMAFGYGDISSLIYTNTLREKLTEYLSTKKEITDLFDELKIKEMVSIYAQHARFISFLNKWAKWYMSNDKPENKPLFNMKSDDEILRIWCESVFGFYEKYYIAQSVFDQILYTQLLNDFLWNAKLDPRNPKVREYNLKKLWNFKEHRENGVANQLFNESANIMRHHMMIHLSPQNLDGQTLTPRIPNNTLTSEWGAEEGKTARISFAPSIDKCLIGLGYNVKGKEFYVHEPVDYSKVKTKGINRAAVPDAHITNEIWAINPVKLRVVAKIVVGEADESKIYTYKVKTPNGEQEVELTDWHWKYIEKYNNKPKRLDEAGVELLTQKLDANMVRILGESVTRIGEYKESLNLNGIIMEASKLRFMSELIEASYVYSDRVDEEDRKDHKEKRKLRQESLFNLYESIRFVTENSGPDFNTIYESTEFYTSAPIEIKQMNGLKEFMKNEI